MAPDSNKRCFFDISIGGESVGRLVFLLYTKLVPLASENFRCLCTGERGEGRTTGKKLHYKGVPFHRIIPGFMCQAGDFERRNGTGGESIYGGKFVDEVGGMKMKHEKPHMLSMANTGKDTNGSQFFITTVPTPHLNGKHVVFGELESGSETLMKMSQVETDKRDAPIVMQRVVIEDCGELIEPAAPSSARTKKKKRKKDKKARKGDKKKRQKRHHDDDDTGHADNEGGQKRNKEKKKKKSKAKRKEEASKRSGKGGTTGEHDRSRENGGDQPKAGTGSENGQAAEEKPHFKGRGGRVYRTPSPERPRDDDNLRDSNGNRDDARRWSRDSYRGRGRYDHGDRGGDSRRSGRGYLDLADLRGRDRVRRRDGWRAQGRYSRSRSPHRNRSLDRSLDRRKGKRAPSRGMSTSPSVRGTKRLEPESRGPNRSRSPKRRSTTSTSSDSDTDMDSDMDSGRKRSEPESRGPSRSRSLKRRSITSTSRDSDSDMDSGRKRSEPDVRGPSRSRSPKRRSTTSTSRDSDSDSDIDSDSDSDL